MPTDYEQLGFKCGVEIHNRIATQHKLFCSCVPHFSVEKPSSVLRRKLRAVAGELGAKDRAAVFEYLRDRTFLYECYPKETCLVEEDEEPPHPVNGEALTVALQISKMLRAQIPDEIHFMRKTVIDGSNTGGFQRTAIVGMNGVLQTSKGPIRITNISLEEESAGIVEKSGGSGDITYRLDRLGIPLIEIGTAPDIKDPEHAREVAEKLGMFVRSTGKSQRGLGVTRQDVNVSIRDGARVEIKGVQDLDSIPKLIEGEILRQIGLITSKESPQPETRVAKPDGTTEFTRPLPGGERMYPETDIPTIVVTADALAKITVPETWDQKLEKLKIIMPADLAEQVLKSEYLPIFEKYGRTIDATLVATTLTSTLKDLRRKGFDTSKITEGHFERVFEAVKQGQVSKEAIPVMLERWCELPDLPVEQMGITAMTEDQLKQVIDEVFERFPQLVKDRRTGALMGEVMRVARGTCDGGMIARVVKEKLG
jgi:Glu-tRNA(Gln) amidotransferase subunit E-like FAD-binding protein